MDSNTSVAVVFAAAFFATAFIISSLLNYRLRSRVLKSGLMDAESLKFINEINADAKRKVLKWALLLLLGGLGLMVLQYTGYSLNEPMPYGIEAVFISIGFFIYYLLAYRKTSTL